MFVPYKGMEDFFLLSLKLSGSSALVTLSNMQMSSRQADESTQVQLTFTQIWPRSKVSLDIFKDTEDRWHILCSVLELQEGPHFTTIFIFSWLRFNHNDQITIEAIFTGSRARSSRSGNYFFLPINFFVFSCSQ